MDNKKKFETLNPIYDKTVWHLFVCMYTTYKRTNNWYKYILCLYIGIDNYLRDK